MDLWIIDIGATLVIFGVGGEYLHSRLTFWLQLTSSAIAHTRRQPDTAENSDDGFSGDLNTLRHVIGREDVENQERPPPCSHGLHDEKRERDENHKRETPANLLS